MKPYYFLVLLTLPVLTACPATPTCIKVVDTRPSHLALELSEGCDSDQPAAIYTVFFFSKTRSIDLWSIAVKPKANSSYEKLSKITYGVVPDGFSGKPAIKLSRGEVIEISVRGIGASEPKIVNLNR